MSNTSANTGGRAVDATAAAANVVQSGSPAATPPSEAIACKVRGLTAAYHSAPVLTDIDLDVPTGVIMGVVGPNGAGKSTLLKCILGLLTPVRGEVEFFGKPLSTVRSRVAYMPQAASVDWDFPATVLDVVTMGTYASLGLLKWPGRKQKDAARKALETVGMSEFANRQIGQLSGGQRQRVFLARALVQEPDLYCMDEPFAGIDAKSQGAILDVLRSLREQGKTVILVHHDLATVGQYCDHVALLNRRLIASGTTAQAFTREAIQAAYEVPALDESFLSFAVGE
ncbi:metal ABC transporter ATP-binding protein [Buchananella felis]|uniref:metal ABC transporter ATP-binding protein n=1 Tax=Buchananella felis TaxID=3231492 RepID=UPI0035295418